MSKNSPKNFFTKNGKKLNSFLSTNIAEIKKTAENISSLAELNIPTYETLTSLYKPTFIERTQKLFFKFKRLALKFYKKYFSKIKFTWVAFSYGSFLLIAFVTVFFPMKVTVKTMNKYSIYSSTPLLLGSTNYQIYSQDARSQKVNRIFKEYNCPLEGMGEVFVYEADKHNIPWWIVAAISFQESSCGKKTPEPGGIESYNAWGWGVYGDNTQSFDNWARGIEVVSEYLNNRFFSKGITEPCDIMKVYTPPSKGSWCEGVNHYGDLIQNYKSPEPAEI